MEEESRTGSVDSENGSDGSYVQVNPEDVALSTEPTEQRVDPNTVPSVDDSEDIYGEQDDTLSNKEPSVPLDTPPPDAFEGGEYIDSPPEPEVIRETPSSVEEVAKTPPTKITSSTTSTCTKSKCEVPVATGYLSFLNALHPLVLCLIYWRDVKISAVVLGVDLLILLTLNCNTFIHTIVLFLLSFLVVSMIYIVAKVVLDSFYNREVKNPFSDYLNKKISLPEDKIIEWTHFAIGVLDQHFNCLVRLLLFDNVKNTLKFGVTLWLCSFITNYLSVLCLLFIAVVGGFSVPPLYERFQPVIDTNVDKVIKTVKETICMIKSRIPYLGKSKSD